MPAELLIKKRDYFPGEDAFTSITVWAVDPSKGESARVQVQHGLRSSGRLCDAVRQRSREGRS